MQITIPIARERPAAAGARYEAAGPQGPLTLWLGERAARHAVDAALRLGRGEPLLEALEDWLGAPLDWRWCPDEAAAAGLARPDALAWAGLRFGEDDTGDGPARALLSVGWPLLRVLDAPPPALAARLQWWPVDAVIDIALPMLGEDDWAALEPGGALLLPDSMQPGWQARLRASGEPPGSGVAVALDGAARATIAATDAATDAVSGAPPGLRHPTPAAGAWLQAEPAQPLAADRLAGWPAGAPLPALGGLRLLRPAAAAGGAPRTIARGRLMPWGDGQAFLVDAMEPPQIP